MNPSLVIKKISSLKKPLALALVLAVGFVCVVGLVFILASKLDRVASGQAVLSYAPTRAYEQVEIFLPNFLKVIFVVLLLWLTRRRTDRYFRFVLVAFEVFETALFMAIIHFLGQGVFSLGHFLVNVVLLIGFVWGCFILRARLFRGQTTKAGAIMVVVVWLGYVAFLAVLEAILL